MSKLVCIVCPRGCTMEVTENNGEYEVTGNFCKRGRDFAVAEQTMPMRTICSTVATAFKEAPVLPVRVSADIPKDKIYDGFYFDKNVNFDVMQEINKVVVKERIGRGDIVIENVLGLGVDVIATASILKEAAE